MIFNFCCLYTCYSSVVRANKISSLLKRKAKKVQESKYKEKAQSENDFHSKNGDGKKLN